MEGAEKGVKIIHHDIFPVNGDLVVWRYMKISKFQDLLQRGKLRFARLDKFDDEYEGFFPPVLRERIAKKMELSKSGFAPIYENWPQRACASCWHINDGESPRMWAQYSTERGIAIRSSISRFRRAFQKFDTDRWGLYGNAVQYTDFETFQCLVNAAVDGGEDLPIVMRDLNIKRRGYEHEREYRLLVALADHEKDSDCKHVPVVLKDLVDEIRVAHAADVDVVRDELQKHGFEFEVRNSEVSEN